MRKDLLQPVFGGSPTQKLPAHLPSNPPGARFTRLQGASSRSFPSNEWPVETHQIPERRLPNERKKPHSTKITTTMQEAETMMT